MSSPARLDRRSGGDGATYPAAGPVMAKAAAENFPVASRLLPRSSREHLLAVYGYARLVDDLGDLAPGDRLTGLDWAERELDRSFAGHPTHPVFVRLSRSVAALGLDRRPFADLLEANRQDQRVDRYPTFEDLEGYCALSANPVGRLVLAIFGRDDEVLLGWSDSICTGLQLVEHWQDVCEDYRAGRIYLPLEDLEQFGVEPSSLGEAETSPELRRLLAFETGRARRLLLAGTPLVTALGGRPRIAIAGFVGGGLAQLDEIERRGYEVLASPVKASKSAVARRTIGRLAAAKRGAP